MEWFRWYHGTVSDPKFAVIAKKSGQPKHVVLAVWAMVIEYASSRDDRGSIIGLDADELSVTLDLETDQIEAVLSAMMNRGLFSDNKLKNWEKRQPKREDATAAERKERWKNKNASERIGTQENASERIGTQENASERIGTQENAWNVQEQRREEKNIRTPLPPKGECDEKRTPKPTGQGEYPADFEAAWKVYPRKDGKRKAFQAWQKAIKRGMPVADMLGHIDSRAYEPDWLKDDGRFVPHMATWLNADGWLDEGAKLPTPRPPDDDDFWAVDFWGNPLSPKPETEVRS